MARSNEFAILQMKLDSLQELIELKQEELADLVKKYMKTYAKYLEIAAEDFEIVVEDMLEDEEDVEELYGCFNCKFEALNEDDHPCFTCRNFCNWEEVEWRC